MTTAVVRRQQYGGELSASARASAPGTAESRHRRCAGRRRGRRGSWSDYATIITTTSGGVPVGWGAGYNYLGAGVTTVMAASAPVVTTTTTEVFEDSVTYTRAAAPRTFRRLTWG